MKKILLIMLTLVIMFSFVACGGSTAPDNGNKSDTTASSKESEDTDVGAAHEVTYSDFEVYTNSIGTTYIQTISEVTNTGTVDLFLSTGSYDLETQDGTLVTSQSMISVYPEVISPGEKAYYYESTILDDYTGDGSDLVFLPRESVEEAKIDNVRFPVTDVAISDGSYGGVKAMGRVENTSTEDESMVYIAVVLYDANNTPIGLVFTILMDDLVAGDKIGFEASELTMPPTVTSESVASFEAFAYPLQFQF